MTPLDALRDLEAGPVSYTPTAIKFMEERASGTVENLVTDTLVLFEKLDETPGPWTAEPKKWKSVMRIDNDLLKAFSMAWQAARPVVLGWRYEMRAIVLILSGKYRLVRDSRLEEEVGISLANIIAAHQAPLAKTFRSRFVSEISSVDPVEVEED